MPWTSPWKIRYLENQDEGRNARIVRATPLTVTHICPEGGNRGGLAEVVDEVVQLPVLPSGQVGEYQDRSARVGLPDQGRQA